ncbi:hypothetical protein N2W54_002037 [Lotmaria passim]
MMYTAIIVPVRPRPARQWTATAPSSPAEGASVVMAVRVSGIPRSFPECSSEHGAYCVSGLTEVRCPPLSFLFFLCFALLVLSLPARPVTVGTDHHCRSGEEGACSPKYSSTTCKKRSSVASFGVLPSA